MMLRGAILTLLTIAVTGCGFSLRGSTALSGNLPELQLNLQQPNSEVARLLRRALEDANVVLHDINEDTLSTTVPLLSVGAEQLVVQPITVTPRARAAQYDIRITLPVNLSSGESNLLGPELLTVQQTYYENTGNITGTQEEIEVIQDEMRRGLVTQLLRRLEAITG
jgi:LPS-assembly lipoprotein